MSKFDDYNQFDEFDASRQLQVCPEGCEGEMVYPVEYEEAEPDHWRMCLRCPECFHEEEGLASDAQAVSLEDVLDAGTEELLAELKRMSLENQEEEIGLFEADIDLFVGALASNAILPEDF